MLKLKMDQLSKMSNKECEKIYSIEMQQDELTEVHFVFINCICRCYIDVLLDTF